MSPIRLSEIIEALDSQSQEIHPYLNVKTGEIVMLTDRELGFDRDLDDASDESVEDDAGSDREVVDSEDYIQLPGQFEIHEYGMMERFSLSLSNASQREALYYSIKGSGAFRRFRDNIHRMGIENDWYKYRDQQLKEIAVDWCKKNNIPYTE